MHLPLHSLPNKTLNKRLEGVEVVEAVLVEALLVVEELHAAGLLHNTRLILNPLLLKHPFAKEVSFLCFPPSLPWS